jgi:integrase
MAKAPTDKPALPYAGFPLYPHASGQWARSIRGKKHYFGVWADWEAALRRYEDEKHDLYLGREPSRGEGLTVLELVNKFLTSKSKRMAAGKLTTGEFGKLKKTCERVRDSFGRTTHVANLRPIDFENLQAEFAKTHGLVTLKGDIGRVKDLFNYAAENEDVIVKYGSEFKKPSVQELRREKAQRPKKLFTDAEIHKMLAAADAQMRAMILLGVNAALGNDDIANLVTAHLDLRTRWVDYPRKKTGVDRRIYLWKETVTAIRKALAQRPEPRDEKHKDYVFITQHRTPWTPKSDNDSPISNAMGDLLDELGLRQTGRNFYSLRHTFNSIGRGTRDRDAVESIMGHREQGVGANYNELGVSDERLKAVSDYVHDWLYARSKTESRRRRS